MFSYTGDWQWFSFTWRILENKHKQKKKKWIMIFTSLLDYYVRRGFIMWLTHNNIKTTRCIRGNNLRQKKKKVNRQLYQFHHITFVMLHWLCLSICCPSWHHSQLSKRFSSLVQVLHINLRTSNSISESGYLTTSPHMWKHELHKLQQKVEGDFSFFFKVLKIQ